MARHRACTCSALSEDRAGEVVVLGGGSAVLWRLLEQPLTLVGDPRRLGDEPRVPPREDDVTGCLDDLVRVG